MMEVRTRDRLGLALAVGLAVALAFDIAQGEWFWVGVVGLVAGALVFERLSPGRWGGNVLVLLWAGYWLGNRGFAQLSPSSSLPLFPAEAALMVLTGWWLWRWARHRTTGISWGWGEGLLAMWLAVGLLRFVPSFTHHGLQAIRDFATLYYAAFFFFAQAAQREHDLLARFDRTLRLCSVGLLALYLLFRFFPGFFAETLVWRGNPLLYYKDDLVGTFLAAAAIAHYLHFRRQSRPWGSLGLALLCAAGVVATHNRASMLGLAVGAAWLALRGRGGLVGWLAGSGAVAGLGLGLAIATGLTRWENTPGPAMLDLAASVVDVEGDARYRSSDTEFKGDNNRFRTVWWTTVVHEAATEAPWLGLGFGHDLASRFLQVYYPDSTDEFTARSPHSIAVTVFARLGVVGLVLFILLIAWLGRLTWVNLRENGDGVAALPGLVAWVVLTSALLGVVLEGPMGAVVFWSAFGLARAAARNVQKVEPNLDNPVTRR